MDDFAPAPAQRTSDDGGRVIEQCPPARRKAARKPHPAPSETPDVEPIEEGPVNQNSTMSLMFWDDHET